MYRNLRVQKKRGHINHPRSVWPRARSGPRNPGRGQKKHLASRYYRRFTPILFGEIAGKRRRVNLLCSGGVLERTTVSRALRFWLFLQYLPGLQCAASSCGARGALMQGQVGQRRLAWATASCVSFLFRAKQKPSAARKQILSPRH